MACDTLIDSYTTQSGYWNNIDAVGNYQGQTFTMGATTRDLCKAKMMLNCLNLEATESVTVECQIRACSGTPGSGALPTGAALATSDSVIITNGDAGWDSYTLYDFIFSTTYTLNASTNYCILCIITAIPDEYDDIKIGDDTINLVGNEFIEQGTGVFASNTNNSVFYIYYEPSWSGKINSVTNPAKICGIPVANINKVSGVS